MRISNHDEQTLGPGHGHVETLGTRHEAQALQSVRHMQQNWQFFFTEQHKKKLLICGSKM
jgi:hypothetical protein